MPGPTRTESRGLSDSPAERVALVDELRAFRVDVSDAPDRGRDPAVRAVEPSVRSGERAADDALLHPRRALGELAVGGETSELGAGARAARRAVVGVAGTQHEVA